MQEINKMTDKEQLEQKIQYWIGERGHASTEFNRLGCDAKLRDLSREYKELTGKDYGRQQ